MKPPIYNIRRDSCRLWIVSNLLVVIFASITNASDKEPEPSRLDVEISIGRQLVADITRFAKQGDSELEHILSRFDLSADTDWEAMRKKPEKLEQILEGVSKAMLTLAEHNDNAKWIVTKYKIKSGPP